MYFWFTGKPKTMESKVIGLVGRAVYSSELLWRSPKTKPKEANISLAQQWSLREASTKIPALAMVEGLSWLMTTKIQTSMETMEEQNGTS